MPSPPALTPFQSPISITLLAVPLLRAKAYHALLSVSSQPTRDRWLWLGESYLEKGWGAAHYGLTSASEEDEAKERLLESFHPEVFVKGQHHMSGDQAGLPTVLYKRADEDTLFAAVEYGRVGTNAVGVVGLVVCLKETPQKWVFHDHLILSCVEWDTLQCDDGEERLWAQSELESEYLAKRRHQKHANSSNADTGYAEEESIGDGGLGGVQAVPIASVDTDLSVPDLVHPLAVRTSPQISHTLLSVGKDTIDDDAYWNAYDLVGSKSATPNVANKDENGVGNSIRFGSSAQASATGLAPDVTPDDLWRTSDVGWQDRAGENADARDEDDYWASYG
ncbi:hypothetical protein M427DRAFT_54025 [Gonapodya prolifera JEL478]|uniref:Uncharacterized protein n=1 Tax=Gonapodya prolifera (strain JEL478) TaxID=1344416 RepID=A0A139ANB1_GONPJ|nr:hypothetical protein M427DRAFT_54025 [Gonapodya prolifera JEL478]|eukprot:KXS18198.1 hypothetical protein M427DRAFT_54025 [Gonapodya prolifera JEL478]